MEPTEAVNALEVAFRELIRLVWGDQWVVKSKVDVSRLEGKLHTERTMRRGANVSTNLLDYTEFTELGEILLNNWTEFSPALGKQKYPRVYIERLNNLRNAPMHSRTLLPFERDLLSGMVGELLNMMAIYRSQRGPDMKHYPVIDSVVDSFGNQCLLNASVKTELRLKVGDVVSFACRGTDPQGRNLLWTLDVVQMASPSSYRTVAEAEGTTPTLSWVVDKLHVGEVITASIWMASDGVFHRGGTSDDQRGFVYAVDPPVETS